MNPHTDNPSPCQLTEQTCFRTWVRANRSACLFVLALFLLSASNHGSLANSSVAPHLDLELAETPPDFCPDDVFYANPDIALGSGPLSGKPGVYQSGFDSTTWSGNLKKFIVSTDADAHVAIAGHAQWEAGSLLTQRPSYHPRTIVTYNPDRQETVLFSFASLPAARQAEFNRSPATAIPDNLGEARVRYLYGDRSMEKDGDTSRSQPFRKRASLLGDIVHSAPVVEGGASRHNTGDDYPAFYAQYNNRPDTIYVGANDGMLHAFSGATGDELFAYIPGPLQQKLPLLTDPGYRHQPFVDGRISINEATIDGRWHTVLAAGMGAGARGLFALDVTRPEAFMAGRRVIVEFTEHDDDDIGYVTQMPQIVKLNLTTSAGQNSAPSTHGSAGSAYFILVPNGESVPGSHADNYLFLLSLDKPPGTPWELNKNYYKIRAGSSDPGVRNSLTSPGMVLDSRGAVIYAYAGDGAGHLWRFDFTTAGSLASMSPAVIFSARDADDRPQPITAQPAITYAPDRGTLILFGTGRYQSPAKHPSDPVGPNSFYAIYSPDFSHQGPQVIHDRRELTQRNPDRPSANGNDTRHSDPMTGADVVQGEGPAGEIKGWYIDFPNSESTGERSISGALIAHGRAYFNTIIPASNPCHARTRSLSYQLEVLTGKPDSSGPAVRRTTPGGRLGTPVYLPTRSDISERDAIGRRTRTEYFSILNANPGAESGASFAIDSDHVERRAGRLSWREIQNWQDLK